ncbi:MAG: hypothetical protein AAF316_01080 [Cyanobacteria bacterium P01_A01_bin.80]
MVIGNEVTRIITLGKRSISQVVNQDETSEKSGNKIDSEANTLHFSQVWG